MRIRLPGPTHFRRNAERRPRLETSVGPQGIPDLPTRSALRRLRLEDHRPDRQIPAPPSTETSTRTPFAGKKMPRPCSSWLLLLSNLVSRQGPVYQVKDRFYDSRLINFLSVESGRAESN